MFRLHIHENDNEIKKIEQKATIFKSDSIDGVFMGFSYEIKRLRLLNNGVLYIIYFGRGILKEIDYDELWWREDEENIEDIVYEISDIYSLNEGEFDDSNLLTASEKKYIINKINESQEINNNWIMNLFIDKKLALIENRKFTISSDLKYLPLNVFEKYEEIINNVKREYQISFFDDEYIPF